MLLTINDSLVQFEQAICTGEVDLYSIDSGQKCDFNQQLSGTSVAEVPSFSSIELTNMDFMTVPNGSQNSIQLDFCNTDFSIGKEEIPKNLNCGHCDTKLNTGNKLCEQKIKHYETTKISKKSLHDKYFKKPINTNNKIKINHPKIDKDLLNNKENLHFSTYHNKNAIDSAKNMKYDLQNYTSDPDQDKFLYSSNNRVVYKTQIINHENKLSQIFDLIKSNNNNNELNIQEPNFIKEPTNDTNPMRKKNCVVYNYEDEQLHDTIEPTTFCIKENGRINTKENKGYNVDCISNVLPETISSNTNNEEFIDIHSSSKENFFFTEKVHNQNTDKLNCSSMVNKQLRTICQPTQNIAQSFCSTISESTCSVRKNYISQTPNESYRKHVVDNNTYSLEYHNHDNMSGSVVLYQNSIPFLNNNKNASKSIHIFHLKCNEHIDKQLRGASNNILAIDGELLSQPLVNNGYSQTCIRKLVNNFDFQNGNIKKLHGKMALAAEHCFNTFDKFIQALEEIEENKVQNEEFRKDRTLLPEGYEHHYNTMQKICDDYINRFSYHKDTNKLDNEYVSIERKIKKWSEFQDLVITIKEARKRKLDIK